MVKYCFGIDVGGTTVKCGFFSVDGEVLEKWEIPTRTENNGENILPDIAKSINEKLEEKKIDKMKFLSVAPIFAEAMTRVFTNGSISKLFD